MSWEQGGRWGEITEISNDKGPYKLVKVQSEGHTMTAIVVEPYGVQASPLKGGQVFLLPFNADNGQAVALVLPPPKDRVDGQKEGEATFKNHKRGQYVKLDDDGNIVINAPGKKVIINAQEFELNANTKQVGNIEQTGDYAQTGVHTDSNGVHG